jgi:hypothetical protein
MSVVRSEDRRQISLRSEKDGPDSRFLDARLDDEGNLRLDGQDLGPATATVSSDGEYEYFKTVDAAHIPALLALLGAEPRADILDELEAHWTGPASYELERLLTESGIPAELFTWGG